MLSRMLARCCHDVAPSGWLPLPGDNSMASVAAAMWLGPDTAAVEEPPHRSHKSGLGQPDLPRLFFAGEPGGSVGGSGVDTDVFAPGQKFIEQCQEDIFSGSLGGGLCRGRGRALAGVIPRDDDANFVRIGELNIHEPPPYGFCCGCVIPFDAINAKIHGTLMLQDAEVLGVFWSHLVEHACRADGVADR